MLYKYLTLGLLTLGNLVFASEGLAMEKLRVFTWDGYITKSDIVSINKELKTKKLAFEVEVVAPFAEGSEQMFNIIRSGKSDISFLTLFFIKMKQEKITNLLQPINIKSKIHSFF